MVFDLSGLEKWAKFFWERRKLTERHELNLFFVHSPKWQLVTMVSTGFIRDTYYMGASELIVYAHELHNEVMIGDPEFHMIVLEAMRSYASIKDQILLGLVNRQKLDAEKRRIYFDREADLLGSFPPKLILRFVEILRKARDFFKIGFSSRQKKLVNKAMNAWDIKLWEYYAMKYPKAMRDLIRLSHPKLEGMAKSIAGFAVARSKARKAPTERLEGYLRFLGEKDIRVRLELALEYDIPFETVRSHLPLKQLKNLSKEFLFSYFDKAMTASATILNVRYLVKLLDDEYAAQIITEKIGRGRVSLYEMARAALATLRHKESFNAIAKVFDKKSSDITKELLPGLKVPKLTVVVDASASMFPQYVKNTLVHLAMLRKLIKRIIVFSDNANIEDLNISLSNLSQLYNALKNKYDKGTNIARGLNLAMENSDQEDIIILFSDEQENAVYEGQQVARVMKKKDIRLIVVNPSPYPTHAFSTKDVLYVPSERPETIRALLKLLQLTNLGDEETEEYIYKLIKRSKEKYFDNSLYT